MEKAKVQLKKMRIPISHKEQLFDMTFFVIKKVFWFKNEALF